MVVLARDGILICRDLEDTSIRFMLIFNLSARRKGIPITLYS